MSARNGKPVLLGRTEIWILRVMDASIFDVLTIYDISAALDALKLDRPVPSSERTLRTCLPLLMRGGFVARPPGKAQGYVITDAGRARIKNQPLPEFCREFADFDFSGRVKRQHERAATSL